MSNVSRDRRRIKALALVGDKRKQDRRQKSHPVVEERRRGYGQTLVVDPRRCKKRDTFFCLISISPANGANDSLQTIEGTILNISSDGMAVLVENLQEWLTTGRNVKVIWNSSTTISGTIIWEKTVSNYMNLGKNVLLGIALDKKHVDVKINRSPILTKDFKSLQSISELTGVDFYPLYIGGKDVDTGIYGFAASADKIILDPIESRNILETFSNGFIPERYWENTYAAYAIANESEIKQATDVAFQAWREYRSIPIARRKHLFLDIYENIKNHRQQLIDLMVREGHPLRLAEWEYAGMIKAFEPKTVRFYLDQLFKKVGVEGDEHLYLIRKPDGVVCVLPPGNAPCPNSLLAAFALLGGNSLIIKPPIRNPISTLYLWRYVIGKVLEANKLAPGLVNLVVGDSERILDSWVRNPKVSDIIYFGDSHTGLEIGSRIYAKGKKPILELSGNDTMVVWKDAHLESAATSLIEGFLGSMQICMVARRALVHPAVYDEFESIVLSKVRTIGGGLPHEERSYLSPVGKIEQFYEFIMNALGSGAQLIYGGTRIDYNGSPDPRGVFLVPTILRIGELSKAEAMKCTIEEGFFPLLTLIKASESSFTSDSDEEVFAKMINFLAKNLYGLRTSIWADSSRYVRKFIKEINNSGILRINVSHCGFSAFVGTHGGPGRSGGPFGELNYLWEKTSHLQGISFKKGIKNYTEEKELEY